MHILHVKNNSIATPHFLAPQNLSKPIVENVNATFVTLQWRKPAIAGGLITSYQLHSYHASTKENKSIQIDNVLSFRSVFHNLHPASLYYFTVEAFTAAGSVESEAVSATTLPAGKCYVDLQYLTKQVSTRTQILKFVPTSRNLGYFYIRFVQFELAKFHLSMFSADLKSKLLNCANFC